MVNISIIGDCHFGYDFGGERGEDSFATVAEALSRSKNADLIIQTGDMFDARVIKQEILARAAKVFSIARNSECNTKLIEVVGKRPEDMPRLHGIPIVCIHGTHERRSKHLLNPLHAMENADLLLHLDSQTAVFDCSGTKVAVHGFSGVPERYAKEFLVQWNPKPIRDTINIFVLHQSIDPYIYSPLEPPSLKLEDLPEGFDLIVCGHMHSWEHRYIRQGKLLLAGSTIPTGMNAREAAQKKCFWVFDGKELHQHIFNYQRRVYTPEVQYSANIRTDVESAIKSVVKESHTPKPVIGIKLVGKLPAGVQAPKLSDIGEKYSAQAIVSFTTKLESEEFASQIDLLRAMREARLSSEEQGLKILQQHLNQANCQIKVDEIFEMLAEGDVQNIFDILTGKQATLQPTVI